MQGRGDTCTLIHANTHTHTCMHIRTHTHHPEVVYDWEVIKEAQRSVKVKGERSNQPGEVNQRQRGTASPHLALGCVCVESVCVGEFVLVCYTTLYSHWESVSTSVYVPRRKCVCVFVVLTLRARVSICGEFDVVARKQTLPPIELSFPPITVVFVEHCDHLTLLEGQLVVVLRHVVVHADHLTQSFRTRDGEQGQIISVRVSLHVLTLNNY